MRKKLGKALFFLSTNSRITTKELGKLIRSSQQSASYLIKQLKKKRVIKGYVTIVDPIKLGFNNLLVGLNFLSFDKDVREGVLEILKQTNAIISIQEASLGVDLVVEYCTPNLSAFNKTHSEITNKLYRSIETKFIFPIVVKHKYNRDYLINKSTERDIVLCGDRQVNILSDAETKVLQELLEHPDATLNSISKATGTSLKTVVNIKKKLEKLFIIRGYGCVINHSALGFNRFLVLLKLSSQGVGEINRLTEYCLRHKNIIELIKIIGDYHVVLVVENARESNIIQELRSNFFIEDYELIEIESVNKEYYLPRNIYE